MSSRIRIGTAARHSDWNTVRWSGYGLSPASTRAASSMAMPRMIVTLRNSAGWSEKPPMTSQLRWPLIVAPSGVRTTRARSTDTPYRIGTALRRARWPSQIVPIIRAIPMPRFIRCRTRKKYGSPWFSSVRLRVAEYTSREPSRDRAVAANRIGQSSLRVSESRAKILVQPARSGPYPGDGEAVRAGHEGHPPASPLARPPAGVAVARVGRGRGTRGLLAVSVGGLFFWAASASFAGSPVTLGAAMVPSVRTLGRPFCGSGSSALFRSTEPSAWTP